MASAPHLRHQSSLEGVIDLNPTEPLAPDQRALARAKFYQIVDRVGASTDRPYNRPLLVKLTYEYARSEESRDNFLRAFFQAMAISIEDDQDVFRLDENHQLEEELRTTLTQFADYLLDNFFLPLKASSGRTPQPSPAFRSAITGVQNAQEFAGTPARVSALRGDCLVRDHHRCVVSHKFDSAEARKRYDRDGANAEDDDGRKLAEVPGFARLEVAHILPHCLTQTDANSQLNQSKQAALSILNMFDYGVAHLIEGTDIDRPRNALTLTNDIHGDFGDFQISFEAMDEPNSYRIESTLPHFIHEVPFPIHRKLYLTETRTIDPPSPRLLAVHRAIARILHLSAAGEYIDKILRDMGDLAAKADGTSDLGRFVQLRLGGWLNGAVDAY